MRFIKRHWRNLLRITISLGALAFILVVLSCVTINVYFPAAEVKTAADQIVEDVYSAGEEVPSPSSMLVPRGWRFFGVGIAHAQVNLDITTPAIRAMRGNLESRNAKLAPFYASGAVGITRSGYLKMRDVEGLSLKKKATLKKLVQAENKDRKQLYKEIVKANGLSAEDVAQVEEIFAERWRGRARSGWWYETAKGEWKQKK